MDEEKQNRAWAVLLFLFVPGFLEAGVAGQGGFLTRLVGKE